MNNKLKYSQTNLRSSASFGSERRSWIIEIRRFLEQEHEEEEDQDIPVCIFNVPKTLHAVKPEAYTPQVLALGPYHHFHDHLHEMERYKLVVTKKVQIKFPSLKFQDLIHHIMKYESKIRSCYHKYLELDSETLTWMMVLDGLFLLDFLHLYVDRTYSVLASETKMSHLVNKAGKRISYDSILRDIFMLENQIPLLVLKKILYLEYSSLSSYSTINSHETLLHTMLIGICKELSPFILSDDLIALHQVSNYAHLLDLLYHLIVTKCEDQSQDDDNIETDEFEGKEANTNGRKHRLDEEEEDSGEVFKGVWNILSKCNLGLISKICKPFKFLVKLPWKFMLKLPGLSMILLSITSYIFPSEKQSSKNENGSSSNNSKTSNQNALLADEVMIPSVTSLYEAGIEFCITTGDISTITFDTKTKILYLPTITLDVNSEVILRNLVAYEATSISGPLVLARYVEFMNGIIDTSRDAKLLREKRIIVNHLKSDKEVADFWNGMSRTIRLTKVPFLDKVIQDVNEYYHSTWKVKTSKFVKRSLHGSWEILVVLATVLFLCLTAIQAFCSIYNCPHRSIFLVSNSE